MTDKVLYIDGDCALCRFLGDWLRKREQGRIRVIAITFSELFSDGKEKVRPESVALRFQDGERMYEGSDAWQALILECQDLKTLGWVAQRLGLIKQTARVLESAGRLGRLLCRRC